MDHVGAEARRYLIAITALAVVANTVLLAAVGLPSFGDPLGFALLVVAIGVAERIEVTFKWGDNLAGITLVEVAITAGLLLLPASHVVAALVVALLVVRIPWHLRTPWKAVFNLASVLLATAIAGLIVTVAGALPPTVGGRSALGALAGMAAYGLVSAIAMAGLLHHLGDDGGRLVAGLRRVIRLTAVPTLGTTAVGIVAAAVWVAQPELVPFVLAPTAAVHLATRASARSAALLETTRVDRARLGRVIDGASDGIVLLDRDGTVQVWNPAMEAISGVAEVDAVGRAVGEVLHAEVRVPQDRRTDAWSSGTASAWSAASPPASSAAPGAGSAVGSAVGSGVGPGVDGTAAWSAGETVARLVASDGTVRIVRERHARGYDDEGQVSGEVVVVRDVSSEHELDRLRSDFVARVSQELRTPLAPIRGHANDLLDGGDTLPAGDRENALTQIVDRTEHLHGLVEDLLLVTRFDGSVGRAEPTATDVVQPRNAEVAPVVERTIETVRRRHPRRRLTLDQQVSRAATRVVADPDRVRQILAMLLDNALRYTPADAAVEVEVGTRGPETVAVRVRDHGRGIPPAERERVFDRFHRLHDDGQASAAGIGLGLYIGRRLARAMQGDLLLLDTPAGEGATFELRLVAADAAPGGRTPSPSDPDHLAAG